VRSAQAVPQNNSVAFFSIQKIPFEYLIWPLYLK